MSPEKKDKIPSPAGNDVRTSILEESFDPKQHAVKFKTFRHLFDETDLERSADEKLLLKKLKKSKALEERYLKYLRNRNRSKKHTNKIVLPWDSFYKRTIFWFTNLDWAIGGCKWTFLAILALFSINYIPGPFQHMFEIMLVRAIYDTAPIGRLPESLETYAHSASITDARGAVLKSYGKRQVTAQIPEHVRNAVVACEDHFLLPHPKNPWWVNAFFIHPGVSWPNLLGAVRDTFRGQARGASTIVMQNAKKVLKNDKRSFANKLEEIVIAYMLVAKFGKIQNLDFYINTVPVGSNIYGFPAAAASYFKKPLEQLSVQQLVAVGSFIPNHNRQLAFYEIIKGKSFAELSESRRFHAQSAINKVNLALGFLRERGEITEDEYRGWLLSDEESIRKIGFRNFRSPLYGEEEWTSWNVIREVSSRSYKIKGRNVSGVQLLLDETGDVVIETAVDLELIQKLKEIIVEFLDSPEYREILKNKNRKNWEKDQAARDSGERAPYEDFESFMEYIYRQVNIGLALVNRHGEIVAYVGGKEFMQGSAGEEENADTGREKNEGGRDVIIDIMNKKALIPPASSMKPVVSYFTMVATNATIESTYADKPIEYKYVERLGRQVWLPRNWYEYDAPGSGRNRYMGRSYNLLEAQVVSVNTIFARLYSDRAVSSAMLAAFDRIGLDYNREDAKHWPFGIGSSEVPVQQWLGVYNAFLDGSYREPSFVKRILINGEAIYTRDNDPLYQPVSLFDSKKERDDEMTALYAICNRGTPSNMRSEFKYYKDLVSGKTGTAPDSRNALFMSHFNPNQNRTMHPDQNLTMVVHVTTNTGGFKNVGSSDEGPARIAGRVYNYIFQRELQRMMDTEIENAKRNDPHFRNNHLYWANVNRYMEHLLTQKCGGDFIHNYIIGVDSFREALIQILSSKTQIYTGRDDLFNKLVDYYCDQTKLIRMAPMDQSLTE